MKLRLKKYSFNIEPGLNKHYWQHINSNDWEPHTFSILERFVNTNSTVLDIGAWSGLTTLYAAQIAKKVYALDPDPVCFKELNKNVELNPSLVSKIQTFKVAISNKTETLTLSARQAYGLSSSSILSRKRDTETSLKIKTIPLIDFLKHNQIDKVDFVKMDVEGAEFRILPNIGEAIKKLKFPTLYISFHYQFLNESIYNEKVPSIFLNKLFLKLELLLGINLFKKRLHRELKDLYNELDGYTYIYTMDKKLVSIRELRLNPEIIKKFDLVFTNQKW